VAFQVPFAPKGFATNFASKAGAVRLTLVVFVAFLAIKFFSTAFIDAGDVAETASFEVTAHVHLEIVGRREGHLLALQIAAPQHAGGATFMHLVVQREFFWLCHKLAAQVTLKPVLGFLMF